MFKNRLFMLLLAVCILILCAAGSASAVEFVERDNGLALKVLDNSSNMGSWTVPFGKTVTADAFSFTFDLNVKSASSGFNSDFFFADTFF